MTGDVADFSLLRLCMAFSVVLALLAGLGMVLKYVGARGIHISSRAGKARRLQIVESLAVDTHRRFVIVECDGRQHLLLLNNHGDIVIETNLSPKVS